MKDEKLIHKIVKENCINTVFQPICSLENGSILGYEALSRIKAPIDLNIEELFEFAEKTDGLWDLEKMCRKKAIKNAQRRPEKSLIFLNIDANILNTPDFKSGFTSKNLKKYNIDGNDCILEITEKTAIKDEDLFLQTISHYKNQNFKIAIDDFGSSYSGMNRVCFIQPDYLKIGIHLISNIDSEFLKRSAVQSIVDFCKKSSIKVIAEGIETLEELKTLIHLNVDYGQGFYLARPNKDFQELDKELVKEIKNIFNKKTYTPSQSFFTSIDKLGEKKETVKTCDSCLDVYERMKKDSDITEFFVVDKNNKFAGVVTRNIIFERFSGQYGFNLSRRMKVKDVMDKDCLRVDAAQCIDKVSTIAMDRDRESIYDSIAIVSNDEYISTVTVKDLLLSSVEIQIKRASDSNPLTGLPGNLQIQHYIKSLSGSKDPWSILYLDLDNFKAYNDSYGFNNGDLMLKALSNSIKDNCIQDEFMGHIGGDDFVIITNYYDVNPICKNICNSFNRLIKDLYTEVDWNRSYIISRNRNGFVEEFPIATISIAVVNNKNETISNMNDFSLKITEAKKLAKQKIGDSVVVLE